MIKLFCDFIESYNNEINFCFIKKYLYIFKKSEKNDKCLS